MGRSLARAFPEADQCFEEAGQVLGTDMRGLCWSASPRTLAATENTQPALLTVAVAAWRAARTEGVGLASAAGHSVGSIASLVATCHMEFAQALRLASLRGRLMASAPGEGAMAAVVSRSEQQRITALMAAGRSDLDLAGDNSPRQLVFSGPAENVDGFVAEVGRAAQRLRVSHAFHSRMMRPVLEHWAESVAAVELVDSDVPVGLISTGGYSTATDAIRVDLIESLCSPVRWRDLMQARVDSADGLPLLGFGPAKSLRGIHRHFPGAPPITLVDSATAARSVAASVEVAA